MSQRSYSARTRGSAAKFAGPATAKIATFSQAAATGTEMPNIVFFSASLAQMVSSQSRAAAACGLNGRGDLVLAFLFHDEKARVRTTDALGTPHAPGKCAEVEENNRGDVSRRDG